MNSTPNMQKKMGRSKTMTGSIILAILSLPLIANAEWDSNKTARIDSKLSKLQYEAKSYVFTNYPSLSQLEARAQSPETTLRRGKGNCVDSARLVMELAEEEGLKAKYKREPGHVVVIVYERNREYRYSNFRNTSRRK